MSNKVSHIPRELSSPSIEFARSSERIGLYWWYWDHLEKKMSVNPSFLKILGYTPDTFDDASPGLGKNIHPDDVKVNEEKIRRLIYGEDERYEMEFRLKGPEGEWLWFYNRGVAIRKDEHGKATLIGGISMDISGKFKQLMTKLDEQEKFEYLFRNTDEAMLTFDLDEPGQIRVVDANQAALDLFGRSAEELMQPMPEEVARDHFVGKKGKLFRDVMEKGHGTVEHKITLPTGEERWLRFSAHAFTRSGKRQVLSIITDLTQGRKTEAALRESEKLYQSLFDAAEDPIGLFSTDQELILINRAFHETFGYNREEFEKLEWLEIVDPEDRVMLMSRGRQFLQEGSLTIDYRARHKNGNWIYLASKNVLIKGEEGSQDMILAIIRDVTDRKKVVEELREAKKKAEESDKLKSAFLANMSHEIRTPMNSIVGFSNLLANPGVDPEARSLYVSRIIRNSELLLTLISDIIDLAKIESGQLTLFYGKQKLHTLLAEMAQYGREELQRLQKDGIHITTELACDDEIETDVLRLNQILKNLVNNALKFTEKGSVRIGCRPGRKPRYVVLFVQDSGIGIDPSHADFIFDQFRQIDGSNTRKYGGTGLGLAICKNLARMMGGEIWVESKPGEGACFALELPLIGVQHSRVSDADPVVTSPGEEGEGGRRILVVEDEVDSLELFREMLQAMGHEVLTATNGYQALEVMEKEPLPDLVFMDDQMPVLSGTETMKIIKERFPGIQVVAQSAHALMGDRGRFLEQGFDDYLPKPFSSDQLQEVLKQK